MTLGKTHLIIGGSVFIGCILARTLLDSTCKVVVVDDDTSQRFDQQEQDFKSYSEYFSFKGNITHSKSQNWIRDVLQGQSVVIWHLAANSDIKTGSVSPDIDAEKTFMTSVAVCNLIEALNVTSVNFASTSAVYGELTVDSKQFSEEMLCDPISYYGAGKLASEMFLKIACERKKVPLAVLRFANIVGSPATHGVIYDFINKLVLDPNQLYVLGNGTQVKTYLHVKSLVEMMIKVETSKVGGIYNLSPGDEGIEVREIAEMVAVHYGTAPKIEYEAQSYGWVGDVVRVLMSNDKYCQRFGDHYFSSKDSIHKAIHEIFNQLSIPFFCHEI